MKSLIHNVNPITGETGVIVTDSQVNYEGSFVTVYQKGGKTIYPSHCILYIEQISDDEFDKREKHYQELEEARKETAEAKLEQ